MRFILCLLAFFSCAAFGEEARYILTFKTEAAAKKFTHPQLVEKFFRYAVIRAPRFPEALNKISDIAAIQEDKIIRVQGEMANSHDILPADRFTCPLIYKDRRGEWDVQMMNTDLMNQELKKLGVGPTDVRIAVIDTGFDPKVNNDRRVRWASAGKMTDTMGHGTLITQRLLRLSPEVHADSYGIFNKKGTALSSRALATIMKSCNDGNKIINFSASMGGLPIQGQFSQLQQDLANKGCLLVEASGNESGKDAYSKRTNKDPKILTVASLDSSGKQSAFSNPGVLSAPGEEIKFQKENGLIQAEKGSSFAVPAASLISAGVYAVMKKSAQFQRLSESQKVDAVLQVLKVSSDNGKIDGYRAVLVAKNLATRGVEDPNDSDEKYVKQVYARERKKPPPASCTAAGDCDTKKACYDAKRRYVALSGRNESKAELEDLRKTALNEDASLAQLWADKINQNR